MAVTLLIAQTPVEIVVAPPAAAVRTLRRLLWVHLAHVIDEAAVPGYDGGAMGEHVYVELALPIGDGTQRWPTVLSVFVGA